MHVALAIDYMYDRDCLQSDISSKRDVPARVDIVVPDISSCYQIDSKVINYEKLYSELSHNVKLNQMSSVYIT